MDPWLLTLKLNVYQKLLLINIAVRTDQEAQWDPTQVELAAAVGVSQSTVSRALQQLLDAGLVRRVPKGTDGLKPGLRVRAPASANPSPKPTTATNARNTTITALPPLQSRTDKNKVLDAAASYTTYSTSGDKMLRMYADLAVSYGLVKV